MTYELMERARTDRYGEDEKINNYTIKMTIYVDDVEMRQITKEFPSKYAVQTKNWNDYIQKLSDNAEEEFYTNNWDD